MEFYSNPIYVLIVLSLMVILSVYAGKSKIGIKLGGPALLVIIFTAIIAYLKLIPSASDSINLYDIIFKYIAPISIFYLLLNINISSIKRAGLPMIGLFILGSLSTTIGILVSWLALSPEIILGDDARIIAGMLTGTYTGGSVNFNAIALEYDFQKKGVLYAGTIAVDNVVTTIWIMITLTIPIVFKNLWKSNKSAILDLSNKHKDPNLESLDFESLIWLIFLGITSYFISDLISSYSNIPSILILTSFGILLAQVRFISNLKGSHSLGIYLVYLFLAVIGAYCELSAVDQLEEIGVTIFLFTILAVFLHGIIFIIIGGLVYRDWDMISIASQANIGGGTSAIALAEAFNRNDLILPAILVGSLGNALGTYLGFLVIYIL